MAFKFLVLKPKTIDYSSLPVFDFKCLTYKEIIGKEIARELLGSEHDGRRIIGLLDCTSEEQFDKELKLLSANDQRHLPNEFTQLKVVFDLYLRECMLRPVRVAAGLGNPPKQMAKPENRGIQHCYKRGDFQTKTDQVGIHDLIE